jgi:uncharacterized small protein (DUF1192 family)
MEDTEGFDPFTALGRAFREEINLVSRSKTPLTAAEIQRRRNALTDELARLDEQERKAQSRAAAREQLGEDTYQNGTVLFFVKTFEGVTTQFMFAAVKAADAWWTTRSSTTYATRGSGVSWGTLLSIMLERCVTIEVVKMERGQVLL